MADREKVELAATNNEGCGPRVVFKRAPDGYSMAIVAVVDDHATPLLRADPAPPFQEVVASVQKEWLDFSAIRSSERPALLLTGAGNGRYWSASVVAITDVRVAQLSFDFACRSPRNALPPTIDFVAADGVRVAPDDSDNDAGCSLAADGLEFYLRGANGRRRDDPEVPCEPVRRVQLDGARIGVEPVGGPPLATGATVRWSFEISLKKRD